MEPTRILNRAYVADHEHEGYMGFRPMEDIDWSADPLAELFEGLQCNLHAQHLLEECHVKPAPDGLRGSNRDDYAKRVEYYAKQIEHHMKTVAQQIGPGAIAYTSRYVLTDEERERRRQAAVAIWNEPTRPAGKPRECRYCGRNLRRKKVRRGLCGGCYTGLRAALAEGVSDG